MSKVAPSAKMRERVRALVSGLGGEIEDGSQVLSELVRRASALVVQEALEAEQRDFVGRERYERGPRQGYRSGYEPGHLDTAEGRLVVERPQVRGAEQPFRLLLLPGVLPAPEGIRDGRQLPVASVECASPSLAAILDQALLDQPLNGLVLTLRPAFDAVLHAPLGAARMLLDPLENPSVEAQLSARKLVARRIRGVIKLPREPDGEVRAWPARPNTHRADTWLAAGFHLNDGVHARPNGA